MALEVSWRPRSTLPSPGLEGEDARNTWVYSLSGLGYLLGPFRMFLSPFFPYTRQQHLSTCNHYTLLIPSTPPPQNMVLFPSGEGAVVPRWLHTDPDKGIECASCPTNLVCVPTNKGQAHPTESWVHRRQGMGYGERLGFTGQPSLSQAGVNPCPFSAKTSRRVVGFPAPLPATEHNLKSGKLGLKPSIDLQAKVPRLGCLGALLGFCFLSN